MVVADMPLESFLNLLRDSAKNLNFDLLTLLVAREADCHWAFAQLENDWASLHDVTGEKIIFVTIDGEDHTPISGWDYGCRLKENVGTIQGQYGLVAFSRNCRLFNDIYNPDLNEYRVSKWAKLTDEEFVNQHLQPKRRSKGWEDSQSLGVSTLLRALKGISEIQVPCMYFELVQYQYSFIIPISNAPSGDFSFYRGFKQLLIDTSGYFEKIKEYTKWLKENKERPRQVNAVAKSFVWLNEWIDSQKNLPAQVDNFVRAALAGDAQHKDVFRAISPIHSMIDPHVFSDLRSHLDRITSLSGYLPILRNHTYVITEPLKECQSFEEIARKVFTVEISSSNKNTLQVQPNTVQIITREVYMESKYKITGGQQGAVGDEARAKDFTQIVSQTSQELDFGSLAEQLSLLTTKLKEEARSLRMRGGDTLKHDAAVESLAAAKVAADENNESAVRRNLSVAGKWIAEFATKVGVSLVAELVKEEIK